MTSKFAFLKALDIPLLTEVTCVEESPNHESADPGRTPDAGGTEQRPPVADGLPVTARRHLLSFCPTLPCRSRSTGDSAETSVKISKKDILNVAKTPMKCTDPCPWFETRKQTTV